MDNIINVAGREKPDAEEVIPLSHREGLTAPVRSLKKRKTNPKGLRNADCVPVYPECS